jgi:hypothetical protein
MPAPIIPWEPCNIPEEIQDELNRRKINRSFKYVDANDGEWNNSTGNWSKYRGPMSPWVRFCSNSDGLTSVGKSGFVFFGGKGFYSDYGFTKNKNNPSIIGYVPNAANDPHTINNDLTADYPIHVPAPEIERINVTIQKELYRRASVEWVCFSKKQLEYMTPYFLVPGITCILEWGWNHYNPISLVDLTSVSKLQTLFNNPYPLYTNNILQSRGNYDVIFGIITNFEWEVDGNKFRCKTEITSKDRIYSGLIVDATAQDKDATDDESKDTGTKPFDSLIQFIDKSIDQFRNVVTQSPDSITQISDFVKYVRKTHDPKGNSNEYLYGVFVGRDKNDKKNKFQEGANKDQDFDYKSNSDLWLNLGLVIDAINFHAAPLKATNGKEMFRVDIDDVMVGAHPNMISSDGSVCLIPNFESPHYFFGQYGPGQTKANNYMSGDFFTQLKPSDYSRTAPATEGAARNNGKLADFRLNDICGQGGTAYRDDIDQVINAVRYENGIKAGSCSFPNKYSVPSLQNENKAYPAHYTGYLRHIYVNVSHLKKLLDSSSDITTYYKLVEKLLEGINGACGSFWDLRLVSGAGDATISDTDAAPMKIVDYKFMSFSNRGTVWSFDYFDADSLLLGISFKPTLSNAQAIRTIYAPTNNPENTTGLTNGTNELLDYKFTDRLKLASNVGDAPSPKADRSGFADTMRDLQQIAPCNNCYQMTTSGIVRRLAIPATDIQALLLDDGDEDNNPKYTGIMPGIQAQFTIQGIGGLRTFMMFLVRNLPEPYSEKNIVFRIVDVQETVEAGKWTTQITAGVIPLRGFIKARLGITT